MFKKILYLSIILLFSISLFNIVLGTDVVMDLNNVVSNNETQVDSNNTNTTLPDSSVNENVLQDSQQTVTTTRDYEDSTELSISNMINIILIVVGVVLILLGIAIIIRLK